MSGALDRFLSRTSAIGIQRDVLGAKKLFPDTPPTSKLKPKTALPQFGLTPVAETDFSELRIVDLHSSSTLLM